MNYSVTGEQLTGIADAIRAKTGGTDPLEFPDGFTDSIGSLEILKTRQATQTWPANTIIIPAFDYHRELAVFKGSDTSDIKGIESIVTTSSTSLNPQVDIGYSQNEVSGELRINMILVNPSSGSITLSANSLTSVATFYY